MILTHHGIDSIKRAGVQTELIGDKYYHVVTMPDGKVWTVENLDYSWAGLSVDGGAWQTTAPSAWYYGNDQNKNGWNGKKCGLLYNWYAVKYLQTNKDNLISGWHIPDQTEWENLINAILFDVGKKLKSLDYVYNNEWPINWGGSNSYGFNCIPSGEYVNGSFDKLGTWARFWLPETNKMVYFSYSSNSVNMYGPVNAYYAYSIRLVKD